MKILLSQEAIANAERLAELTGQTVEAVIEDHLESSGQLPSLNEIRGNSNRPIFVTQEWIDDTAISPDQNWLQEQLEKGFDLTLTTE